MLNKKHSTKFPLITLVCLALIALCYYSCRKDTKTETTADLSLTVSQAQKWYEATYPVNTAKGKLSVQSTGAAGSSVDLSQLLIPDWAHGNSYRRFGADVVELPLAASSANGVIGLGNTPALLARYKPQCTRSSYLIINDSTGYHAYIMTIIADSAYIKNDVSRLNRDKYNKRDSDFSGILLYTTPKGKQVSSFTFQNGQIMNATYVNASGQVTQSYVKNSSGKQVDEMAETEDCYDVYWNTYGNGVLTNSEYLYTFCEGSNVSGGGAPVTTPGEGGGTPSSPCSTSGITGHVGVDAVHHLGTFMALPNPTPGSGSTGSGYPPPTTTTSGCVTSPAPATTTTTDPCAQAAALTTMTKNAYITRQNDSILNETVTQQVEFGADQNLTCPTCSTFKQTPTTENGNQSKWKPTITWDAHNGYTIGFSHGHPGNDGPSPDDVNAIVSAVNISPLLHASTSDRQNFENDAFVNTETTTGSYIFTINNWSTAMNILEDSYTGTDEQNGFNAQYTSLARQYLNGPDPILGDGGAYALTTLFQGSINVYFASAGSTTYLPVTFTTTTDSQGNVTIALNKIPCPTNP